MSGDVEMAMRMLLACGVLGLCLPATATDKPPAAAPAAAPVLVPYRLTNSQHVLVRAKINGKGPFNFILDPGAPALFVSKKGAGKGGVANGECGRAAIERFEVEGGVVFENAWGRVDDLLQLEGMNGMGL